MYLQKVKRQATCASLGLSYLSTDVALHQDSKLKTRNPANATPCPPPYPPLPQHLFSRQKIYSCPSPPQLLCALSFAHHGLSFPSAVSSPLFLGAQGFYQISY